MWFADTPHPPIPLPCPNNNKNQRGGEQHRVGERQSVLEFDVVYCTGSPQDRSHAQNSTPVQNTNRKEKAETEKNKQREVVQGGGGLLVRTAIFFRSSLTCSCLHVPVFHFSPFFPRFPLLRCSGSHRWCRMCLTSSSTACSLPPLQTMPRSTCLLPQHSANPAKLGSSQSTPSLFTFLCFHTIFTIHSLTIHISLFSHNNRRAK